MSESPISGIWLAKFVSNSITGQERRLAATADITRPSRNWYIFFWQGKDSAVWKPSMTDNPGFIYVPCRRSQTKTFSWERKWVLPTRSKLVPPPAPGNGVSMVRSLHRTSEKQPQSYPICLSPRYRKSRISYCIMAPTDASRSPLSPWHCGRDPQFSSPRKYVTSCRCMQNEKCSTAENAGYRPHNAVLHRASKNSAAVTICNLD